MRRPHRNARICWILLASLALAGGAPRAARAQSETPDQQSDVQQKAAAEALFDEGRQLFGQGQFENACRKFEQSEQIAPAVGILLYLGDCYERVGRSASAWAIFRSAASEANASGQTERAHMADERARKLSVTLSKLVLTVPADDAMFGFELLLDGRAIAPALFGVPFPVDPGQHSIVARAPGRTTWSQSVEMKSSADYRNVQIPLLGAGSPDDRTAAPPARASAPGMPAAPSAAPSAQPQPLEHRPDRTGAYVLGGAGVFAIGVGAVFGLRASDKDEESKRDCPSGCITPKGADLNSAARTSALVANISYGVGAAALLTSAYLLLVSGSSSGSSAASEAAPGLTLGGGFGAKQGLVSVSGNF